jgi:hypothetical protein
VPGLLDPMPGWLDLVAARPDPHRGGRIRRGTTTSATSPMGSRLATSSPTGSSPPLRRALPLLLSDAVEVHLVAAAGGVQSAPVTCARIPAAGGRIRRWASRSRGRWADGLTGEQLRRRRRVDGLAGLVHGFFLF